ncbi:hypothetical protein GCM10009838_18630 [Catenulispora subtropica]|uniref:Ricin B lectin domain-containing protein n=1 Tax=Catenulispora subtropica TaxID=450798 RepID=A0ABN2R1Z2_9ACTN
MAGAAAAALLATVAPATSASASTGSVQPQAYGWHYMKTESPNSLCLSYVPSPQQLTMGSCGATQNQWSTYNNGDGSFTIYANVSVNACLDADATNMRAGGRVQVWACNGQPQQKWFPEYIYGGIIWHNGLNRGLVLDANNDGVQSPATWGDRVQLWTRNAWQNQIWNN